MPDSTPAGAERTAADAPAPSTREPVRDRGPRLIPPSARPGAALHAIARMPDIPTPRFVPDGALL